MAHFVLCKNKKQQQYILPFDSHTKSWNSQEHISYQHFAAADNGIYFVTIDKGIYTEDLTRVIISYEIY